MIGFQGLGFRVCTDMFEQYKYIYNYVRIQGRFLKLGDPLDPNSRILIIGTPGKVPLILGTPIWTRELYTLRRRLCS